MIGKSRETRGKSLATKMKEDSQKRAGGTLASNSRIFETSPNYGSKGRSMKKSHPRGKEARNSDLSRSREYQLRGNGRASSRCEPKGGF